MSARAAPSQSASVDRRTTSISSFHFVGRRSVAAVAVMMLPSSIAKPSRTNDSAAPASPSTVSQPRRRAFASGNSRS